MSTLTVTNIKATGETNSRAVSGVAAAWCNADGTGTVVINGSTNTSSITDNGTGQYTLTWTNAFSNGDYSHSGSDYFYGLLSTNTNTFTTTSSAVYTYSNLFAVRDNAFNTSAHGDLA